MMPFAKLYLLLVLKAERKGRTRDEVDQVTTWLTGYTPQELSWAGTVRHQLGTVKNYAQIGLQTLAG